MWRSVGQGLISLGLILGVLGGGAGFPVFDALAAHGLTAPKSLRPHYDDAAGCHADRCSVVSPALDSRSSPEPLVTLRVAEQVSERRRIVSAITSPFLLAARQNHSRAPPEPQS